MLALKPRVVDAVWASIEGHLPPRPPDRHPLGCHRPRIPDRDCFTGILLRLVTGCSWDVAAQFCPAGETTLRNRANEWLDAGVFDLVVAEALDAYDRIIGLDLDHVAIDGSQHKAPMGGEGTGPNPTDKCKAGWKWSLLTDGDGIPLAWVTDGANRHDVMLLAPTLDAAADIGLLEDIGTLHLDRGYDNSRTVRECHARGLLNIVCPKKNRPGQGRVKLLPLGRRWPVERTNSWLSNFGQLRRNTDRTIRQRLAQFALAVTLIITIKLVKRAERWRP